MSFAFHICAILQVLVLTHALASEEEAVPYMEGHASKALKVAGRSAGIEPQVPSRPAVFYGWQDVLLPLMVSGLVPDDTLFLVCEEDFRFAPDEGTSLVDRTVQETEGQALVKVVQQSTEAAGLAREAARQGKGSFSAGWQTDLCENGCDGKCIGVCSHRAHRHLPGKQQRGAEHSAAPVGRWRQRGAEHSAAPAASAPTRWSQEVEDLVAYCNLAHKGQAGDIVWLSWCPHGRADAGVPLEQWELTPNHGATCVGVTVRGAMAMSGAMKEASAGHFDIWLKNQLMNKKGSLAPEKHGFFGASYLWPPIGSYATHRSANAAPPAKGSAKKNRNAGLTETGDRLEDWGYPNQPCTRIRWFLDGRPRADAKHEGQVWHSFQLVHFHLAQEKGPRRIVFPQNVVQEPEEDRDGKVHLDQDMHKCLWWTFGAAAMNDLDKWACVHGHPGWSTAVTMFLPWDDSRNPAIESGLQGAEHFAASASGRGSQGAELFAAPSSKNDPQDPTVASWQQMSLDKHRRNLRMKHQWCLRRVDHRFCEACLQYVAYVVMRAALMQITSCHYGYGMLCRLAPSSTTSARRLLGTTCRMPFSLMFAVCGPASMSLGRSRLGTTARSRGGFAVPIGTQPA